MMDRQRTSPQHLERKPTLKLKLAMLATASATKVLMHDYPLAKCLDGSPSGYYVRPATQPGFQNKFLVVLEGGGICTGKDDCTARATTDLGSSKNWAATFDWNSTAITTEDPRNDFSGWTTVWAKYCDGSVWSGARSSAIDETFGLWFAGHHTVDAMLRSLSASHGLNSTSSPAFLAFAGGSADGLGVFYNNDFVATRLPAATVVGVHIGGCARSPLV